MPTVEVPEGTVDFPDSMSQSEIESALNEHYSGISEAKKKLADEMAKVRRERFLTDQEQAAIGAAQNIAKVAAIPATPILKLPRSEGTGVGAGLLNLGAGAAEGISAPAYWMLPASRPLQALIAGQTAGNIPESTVNAIKTLTNPDATKAQKVEAVGNPILQAAVAAAITKGANAANKVKGTSGLPPEQQGVPPERPTEGQTEAGTPQRSSEGEQTLPQPTEVQKEVEKVPSTGESGKAQPSAGPIGATVETPVPAGETPQAMPETATPEQPKQVGNVTQHVTEPISQGPGAASPGDIPQGSQLAQLTEAIGTQLSPSKPLGERISSAVNIADKWAKGKDAVTQGIAKARAASQALIDSYVNLPKWTSFRDAIGKWTSADQETALEVYKFQKQIMKAVPDRLRQEAITNWIQADGDEALLRSRAEASKPNVRRGYELALQLTPAEKTLARNVSSYLDARLQEGIGAGLLKQGVDNYVTQVWKRSNEATKKLWADLFGVGTLNPNFKFARKRIFDSYFEGEQAGYTPKNKTIGNLVSQYDLSFNRALSARALIKRLQEGTAEDGKPITMTSGKTSIVSDPSDIPEAFLIKPNMAPEGAVSADGRPYRPIDHWALRDWKWATKGPNGEPVFVQGDMLVHPDHWEHLNNVLKTSRLRANPITGPILKASALAKQTKLFG